MTVQIDPATILRDVTPADVDAIVDAVRATLDAKVAAWQLDEPVRSTINEARTGDAIAALEKLTVAGTVLWGDLGDVIVASRADLVRSAIARQESGR